MREPLIFSVGDTLTWIRLFSEVTYYDHDGNAQNPKASDGWTLTYYAKNASSSFSFAASADGDDYLVLVTAATTAAYTAGVYAWTAYVAKGTERYEIDSGTVEVLPNMAASGALDRRTHAKKMLDAIETLLEGRIPNDVNRYAHEGVDITRMTPEELLLLRDRYRAEYVMEQRLERTRKGLGHRGRILGRFK